MMEMQTIQPPPARELPRGILAAPARGALIAWALASCVSAALLPACATNSAPDRPGIQVVLAESMRDPLSKSFPPVAVDLIALRGEDEAQRLALQPLARYFDGSDTLRSDADDEGRLVAAALNQDTQAFQAPPGSEAFAALAAPGVTHVAIVANLPRYRPPVARPPGSAQPGTIDPLGPPQQAPRASSRAPSTPAPAGEEADAGPEAIGPPAPPTLEEAALDPRRVIIPIERCTQQGVVIEIVRTGIRVLPAHRALDASPTPNPTPNPTPAPTPAPGSSASPAQP
jgi:hypothetical protein